MTDDADTGVDYVTARVRHLREAGDIAGAAATVIRGYGPELLTFLRTLSRDEWLCDESFSVFAEDLVRGLPTAEVSSSFRAWCYVVCRNALRRTARRERRHLGARIEGDVHAEVHAVAEAVRTATAPYLKTEAKAALRDVTASLRDEDRLLLYLRIDRALSWDDIAAIVVEDPADPRAPARLRKQFQRVRERVRVEMERAGVIHAKSKPDNE